VGFIQRLAPGTCVLLEYICVLMYTCMYRHKYTHILQISCWGFGVQKSRVFPPIEPCITMKEPCMSPHKHVCRPPCKCVLVCFAQKSLCNYKRAHSIYQKGPIFPHINPSKCICTYVRYKKCTHTCGHGIVSTRMYIVVCCIHRCATMASTHMYIIENVHVCTYNAKHIGVLYLQIRIQYLPICTLSKMYPHICAWYHIYTCVHCVYTCFTG